MKNVPIIAKFLSILGLFGVFAVLAAVVSTSEMRSVAGGFEHVTQSSIAAAQKMTMADLDIANMTGAFTAISDAVSATDIRAAASNMLDDRNAFDKDMAEAGKLAPDDAASVFSLKTAGDTLINPACAGPMQSATKAQTPQDFVAAQLAISKDCTPSFPSVMAQLNVARQQMQRQAELDMSALKILTKNSILVTFSLIFGGIAVVMTIGFFATRSWVVAPMQALQSAMERLAAGELGIDVAGIDRRDEIGGMAHATQVFKDAAVEKQRLESEAKLLAEGIQRERDRTDSARAAALEQQSFVVNALGQGLEKLSKGDLLFRLTTNFSTEYEKLRIDFNSALQKLQETVTSIASNTQAVRSGAAEITHATDDLSRRTENQAASLEETAAALDQITATVRKSAESATEARDVVTAAKSDAERSGEVVRETVSAMSGIETSSKQIGNIIGVIDEIAFQTNLLALNAGVEAARAGDAGRGFAVVATEVRALAQRSADAAKEIKALISTSGAQVQTGVKLVGETGKALGRIVEQVNRLNALVGDIAGSAQEQATGLNEVNSAVNQMDQVTQQNAAMVEQTTAASHSLASEAQELSRLVAQFQVGVAPAAFAEPSRDALANRKPRQTIHAPSGKFVTVAQPALTAGTVDDWNEF